MKLLLQIFKTMIKSEFYMLIKHCFGWEKILFKQSNSLLSVIRTMLCWKQQLRGGMLTLNMVVQTQMMLNTQVTQIRQLSRKTPKNSTNSFWLIVNWSCMRYQRSCRYQKAVYLPFCMNICQWESCFQSGCHVYSQLIKNNTSTIQNIACNCFNATIRSFCINMWQWMKHGSITSSQSQIGSQPSG